MEIKCPYTVRDMAISQAVAQVTKFCLTETYGKVELDREHDYYCYSVRFRGGCLSLVLHFVTLLYTPDVMSALREFFQTMIFKTNDGKAGLFLL